MIVLQSALATRQVGLALLHGQAFFVLGISIIFLARRGARLEVARILVPLSLFGFCEALAAWIRAWLGISDRWEPELMWLRLLLLGVGYAALLMFAIQAGLPSGRQRWARWVIPAGLWVTWLGGMFVAHLCGASSEQVWLGGELAVRYGLAFPGGLMGAWGLRRETYRTIERDRLPLVKLPLRVTGFALGIFSIFGGLIGPAVSFFPANLINEDLLLNSLGISISLFRGLCGLAITYGVVRALVAVLSEVELWLEDMERMQALVSERERIGRELHDGIIQSIYAAGLMLESARHNILTRPEEARNQLTRAIKSLNQTIQDIRRYIFDLRGELPRDNLETGLRKILKDFRVNTLLETCFSVKGEDEHGLGAERRQHVFQIAREALTNVARHSQARRVEMSLWYGANALQLCVSDDGVGLSRLPNNNGHGLRNIRERARLLGGMLDIDTAPHEGLTIILTVPY